MEKYIVSASFGKVEMTDENGEGITVKNLYCDQCGAPNLVEGDWFLKDCPNLLYASFECENCHKVWPSDQVEGELVTEHNMDLSAYCK